MIKIYAGRGSLIGDTVMFLPILNLFEKLYPNSYKIFPISQKTSHSSIFFLNHKLIDKIKITDNFESIGENDMELIKKCQIGINPFPNHPPFPGFDVGIDNFWYNNFSCVEETVRMAGINLDIFNKCLLENEKKPKLEQWFEIKKNQKSIAIHACAGYNKEHSRNPNTEYWTGLTKILQKMGYSIFHCGVESENDIGENINRVTKLSLFEQIKIALGCDVVIGTDSGFNWLIGAYGHPMINLLTNHAPNHIDNLHAFAPLNYKNNEINLLNSQNINKINYEDIINSIATIKT